jgi:hydroxymethylglutaryl-CoA synthase
VVGIERLGVYVPNTVLPMEALAEGLGIDPEKCLRGIGQERMAVPSPDEDIVTMGAAAAKRCMDGIDPTSVAAVILSTESGIDQSKAGSVYIHQLLGLPSECLCWEVKQACSGSTMALINALDFVARRPDKRVLVVASDIAVYEPGSPGELTQGAGAVAVLVSNTPALVEIGPELGCHTVDVMDFWRPNYSRTAFVDGRLSIKTYLQAVGECWNRYEANGGVSAAMLERVCFHQPFTRLADKALKALSRTSGKLFEEYAISASQLYNRQIGNTYSASMFIGLCSLLENESANLEGAYVGLFGYGSGAVAAFYAGRVMPGYDLNLKGDAHRAILRNRDVIDYQTYRRWMNYQLPSNGESLVTPELSGNSFRLTGIADHQRHYDRV